MNSSGNGLLATHAANTNGNPVKSIVTCYINTHNTITLPKKIKVEIQSYCSTPIASGIYKIDWQFQMNIGLSKPIMKESATLAFNVKDIFNTFDYRINTLYSSGSIYTVYKAESSFANLVFTFKFGNTKVSASKARTTGLDEEKGRLTTN